MGILALKSALVVGGVLAFFMFLRIGANRPAKRDPQTGDLVLQCGTGLVWTMGAIAVGGPLSMAVLSFLVPFQHEGQVFVPVALGGFFLLLGGSLCLWALRRRTRIGKEGLTSEYVLLKTSFLPWDEVKTVSFASGQEFWVRGPGRKAMLLVWFVGVKESVPLLRAYLPEEVQKKCRGTIDRFAMNVGASDSA